MCFSEMTLEILKLKMWGVRPPVQNASVYPGMRVGTRAG